MTLQHWIRWAGIGLFFPVILLDWVVIFCRNWIRKTFYHYPPGPAPLPMCGNVRAIAAAPLDYLLQLKERYGPVASIHIGHHPAVVISDCRSMKLLKNVRCSGKPDLLGYTEGRIFGDKKTGVVCTEGDTYGRYRKFLFDSFNELTLAGDVTEATITELGFLGVELQSQDEFVIDTAENPFNIAITNALWTIVRGFRFQNPDTELYGFVNRLSRYVREAGHVSSLFFFPWITTHFGEWWRLTAYRRNINAIMKFVRGQFTLACMYFDLHPPEFKKIGPRCLFRNYFKKFEYKDPQSFRVTNTQEDRLQMCTTMADLFICGTESVSTLLNWAIRFLTLYPEVQEELHLELATFGDGLGGPRVNTSRLPYTSAVVSEILRCASVVPVAPCHVTTEDVQLGPYCIPKNTLIVPNLYACHRDANLDRWGDDAFVFNPDRFLSLHFTQNGDVMRLCHTFPSLLPFSTGQRACIGRNLAKDMLTLFLVTLIPTFRFETYEPWTHDQRYHWRRNCIQNILSVAPQHFKVRYHLRDGMESDEESSASDDSL